MSILSTKERWQASQGIAKGHTPGGKIVENITNRELSRKSLENIAKRQPRKVWVGKVLESITNREFGGKVWKIEPTGDLDIFYKRRVLAL